MKVLITGGNGQLGHALAEMLSHHELRLTDTDTMDITNPDQVEAVFADFKPEVLVHGAAYTNVDGCEQNPELAEVVNAQGTRNLVEACRKYGIRMIDISTDYVFDGTKKGAYRPEDPVHPISVYGHTKLEGELATATLPSHCIIRTSWVFGDGENFVKTMLRLAEDHEELRVVGDQFGRPTWAKDLAHAIADVIASPELVGIIDVTGDGPVISWAQFAAKIFAIKRLDVKVVPITTAQYLEGKRGQVVAPRPANSALDLTKTKTAGIYLADWEDSLRQYLS